MNRRSLRCLLGVHRFAMTDRAELRADNAGILSSSVYLGEAACSRCGKTQHSYQIIGPMLGMGGELPVKPLDAELEAKLRAASWDIGKGKPQVVQENA